MKKRRWLRWLLVLALAGAATAAAFVWWMWPGHYAVGADTDLPVRYAEGLVYVEPVTTKGAKLSLLADTGGGQFMTRRSAERCGVHPVTVLGLRLGRLPQFRPDAWIPEPTGGEKWMRVVDGERDGMLGQRWFAGGVWTFDYPGRRLVLRHAPFTPTAEMSRHATPLGFRLWGGMRTANHPRFVIHVGGEAVDALFDTGATVWLSPDALRVVRDSGPSERATSFVSADLFRRWRKAHPKWRVIEKGCRKLGEALIEVPEVEVAGLKAGPVWFTRRPTENYQWMSSFMDRPISASVGGDFLRHFRVTLDYLAAVAYFEKLQSGQGLVPGRQT